MNKNTNRLRWVLMLVIGYMFMAFMWWTVLLVRKNEDAKLAKLELLRMGQKIEGIYNENIFSQSQPYQLIFKKYRKQERMIYLEGTVILIGFLVGIWYINSIYNKEVGLNNQRRNFLLSITHELKSPIASIQLVLQTFLKRQLEKSQSDKLSQSALKEADRLNQLVSNLLLSAKLDTAYEPIFEELEIEELASDLIQKMKIKYPTTRFELHLKNEIPTIQADNFGLTSVMINLLENAVKYSPAPTEAFVILALEKRNNTLLINVIDEGLGIAEKERKKIFEKFYRIGNEDTRHTKGTGLGLFIVEQIVKAHQGKIDLKSNPKGQGSVFMIEIPV